MTMEAGIIIDRDGFRAWNGKTPVRMSLTPYRVLVELAANPGRMLSREELLDLVWGLEADVIDRTVDAAIARVRRALKNAGLADDPIKTVRGKGYVLKAAVISV